MNTSFTAVADDRMIRSSHASLLRRARSLVGPVDAEDVVQEAFERALRSQTARTDADPRPWLNRITRNVAYNTLKSRARAAAVPAAPDAESAEHAVVRHETAAELDGALQQLSPMLRRTIVLHDLQGYSNHEIASLDGVSYHTVRTRLFRARRSMRDALAPVAA
jgi:RNA polymerase sigma-70 factor, ECF subfamily